VLFILDGENFNISDIRIEIPITATIQNKILFNNRIILITPTCESFVIK